MARTDGRNNGILFKTLAALSVLTVAAACGPPPRAIIVQPVPAPERQLESLGGELPIDQVVIPTRPAAPLDQGTGQMTDRISLTATNANVRDLIPTLAAAAGVSLLMTQDVSGRVSVILRDVSPLEALRAVIEEAGLTVGGQGVTSPFSPVVFYELPVNINTASAATIKTRFAVSDTTAAWIVRARKW